MAVQIQVSDEVWQRLISYKKRPSQTFTDTIERLLDLDEKKKEKK